MSSIHLVRHGQASFGAADYDLLSERGERQARVLGLALASTMPRVGQVVCGDMRRHRQTAEACLQAMARATDWHSDSDWNEFDHVRLIAALRPEYADHDALRAELQAAPDPQRALKALFEQAMTRWVGGEHDDDYAETWTQFRARGRSWRTRCRRRRMPWSSPRAARSRHSRRTCWAFPMHRAIA